MKIIINTISTKKHAGGAFQIAINFLLKSLEDKSVEWYYFTSTDVDELIGDKFLHLKGDRYHVFPTQPDFLGSYRRVQKEVFVLEKYIKPNIVYSITAPSYLRFQTREVMRFTNPWVTHPNKYSWSMYGNVARIKQRLYCLIQRVLMKNAYAFITQTETTKRGIIRITGLPSIKVCVVNNVLPNIFKTLDTTEIRNLEWIDVACVGAPIPHKNFDILPNLLIELEKLGIHNVRFHTTIPSDSALLSRIMNVLRDRNIENHIINHGRISQEQLGEVYSRCQFCFLPTLLEVFSASMIEAMYYRLPIVATNFEFNSDVLGDSCLYYEPKNATDAAHQFEKLIKDEKLQEQCKVKMQKILSDYDDYAVHFESIKKFLIDTSEIGGVNT